MSPTTTRRRAGNRGSWRGFSLASTDARGPTSRKRTFGARFWRRSGKYFGRKAASPTEFYIANWPSEIWSRGCYSGIMPTGVWTGYPNALRTPAGRIHWAGTETATGWANTWTCREVGRARGRGGPPETVRRARRGYQRSSCRNDMSESGTAKRASALSILAQGRRHDWR